MRVRPEMASFARGVVSWLVVLSVLTVVVVAVALPIVVGASTYAILTPSMEPDYPPGSLVVMRPRPNDTIAIGDVITFQADTAGPEVVTHRVVAVSIGADGQRRFITQGDANDVRDAKPVAPDQVRGALWYSLPWLGHLSVRLTGSKRLITTAVGAAALVCYAVSLFVSAARDRRRVGWTSS